MGNSSVLHLRFPKATSYKVIVYAKECKQEGSDGAAGAGRAERAGGAERDVRETVYGAVCEYKVLAVGFEDAEAHRPMPACQSLHFGPNEFAKRYDIKPDFDGCSVLATNGLAFSPLPLFSSHPPPLILRHPVIAHNCS